MATTYFLHRIQKETESLTKGIEVHETLDSAILSFWGRMKTGYNNPQYPNMEFVSCKITDSNGNVYDQYNKTWLKDSDEPRSNFFFLHSIRKDGDVFTKGIDMFENEDSALVAYATAMEYGYNNPRHADVSFVYCEITDLLSGGMVFDSDIWNKTEEEPEGDL